MFSTDAGMCCDGSGNVGTRLCLKNKASFFDNIFPPVLCSAMVLGRVAGGKEDMATRRIYISRWWTGNFLPTLRDVGTRCVKAVSCLRQSTNPRNQRAYYWVLLGMSPEGVLTYVRRFTEWELTSCGSFPHTLLADAVQTGASSVVALTVVPSMLCRHDGTLQYSTFLRDLQNLGKFLECRAEDAHCPLVEHIILTPETMESGLFLHVLEEQASTVSG